MNAIAFAASLHEAAEIWFHEFLLTLDRFLFGLGKTRATGYRHSARILPGHAVSQCVFFLSAKWILPAISICGESPASGGTEFSVILL
jgi:hypothetical protein